MPPSAYVGATSSRILRMTWVRIAVSRPAFAVHIVVADLKQEPTA
jgi:hypothetical protein